MLRANKQGCNHRILTPSQAFRIRVYLNPGVIYILTPLYATLSKKSTAPNFCC